MSLHRADALKLPLVAIFSQACNSVRVDRVALMFSIAMIIGTFLCVDRINGLSKIDAYREVIRWRQELSAYLGSIENGSGFRTLAGDRGVDTNGGSQDHTAILCCEANAVSRYAFCPVRLEGTISFPGNLRLIVGVSGIVAEKTGDALHRYNAVADSARTIVNLFNAQTRESVARLADAVRQSPQSADQIRGLIAYSPTLLLRFEQFISESDRIIPAATEAIRQADWNQLGSLADESQSPACAGEEHG